VRRELGDELAANEHQTKMEGYYRATKMGSLIERCARLAHERDRGGAVPPGAGSSTTQISARQLSTVVHLIRHGGVGSSEESGGRWALEQLAQFAGFEQGHLYLLADDGLRRVSSVGGSSALPELDAWAQSQLRDTRAVSSITAEIDGLAEPSELQRLNLNGQLFRLVPLRIGVGVAERVIGAVVAEERDGQGLSIPFDLLRAAAARVHHTQASEQLL
jgi:hypothetical protein